MKTINRAVAAAALALLASFGPGTASATEGGSNNIGKGSEGFFPGMLPEPGWYGVLYANHYQAPRVNDGRGNSAVPGCKLFADVMAGRIFYMSNATHRNGVGDITVGPTLGWDFGAFHPLVAMDLVLPVGGYGTDRARLPSCGVAPDAPAPPGSTSAPAHPPIH